MTTYGTIQTSSSPSSTNLEYVSRAKQMIKAGLGTRRPWKLMFNLRSLGVPAGVLGAVSRVGFNAAYFRMNYAIVVLLILFLSLLWQPISLIVFLLLMAAWLFLYFLCNQPLLLLGHLVDNRLVLVFMAVLTVALLLLTQATVNILVVVLVGAVVVVVHAALRRTEDLLLDEEEGPYDENNRRTVRANRGTIRECQRQRLCFAKKIEEPYPASDGAVPSRTE